MIAGKKQHATMKAAAIHLKTIFKTGQNGISKSTIETRCDKTLRGFVTRIGSYYHIGPRLRSSRRNRIHQAAGAP
jgi:hypothetical protein